MRNLIIGMASTYSFKDIEVFFKTLDQTGYNGTLGLFTLNPSNIIIPHTSLNVELIDFSSSPHLLLAFGCYRPRVYLDYLRATKGQYAQVFLTDTRDVFFQKSPFDYRYTKDINFFLENSERLIKECPFNAPWVRSVYGSNGLNKIGHNNICNVSLSLGTYDGMVNYLELITPQLTSGIIGADMAVHNYMVHTNAFPNCEVFRNGDGGIATIGSTENHLFNVNGQLVNERGEVAAVVHQYDRHPNIVNKVRAQCCIL